MVDGRRRGNGRREYFKNVAEAETRADQLAVERENHGTASLNFPARDRVMTAECRELLRPWDRTIRDATEHYVGFLKAEAIKSQSPLIRDCVQQFLTSRERDVERGELAKRTLTETRHFTKHLMAAVGGLRIAEFDVDVVTTFLDSFPVSARTRLNIRLRLSKFFSFCRSKKWIATNPCADIQIKVRRGEVTILSVEDTEQLLRAAEASQFRNAMAPYVACCLFGGLRPHEAQQLKWEQINFETATIHVLAHTSKRRESRYVHIEPALMTWLRPYVQRSGNVAGTNFRYQWRSVVEAAGYGENRSWPQDVMRHTAASMLLALKRNRALVAEELGTSVNVLRRHYRQPILKADAALFWALRPTALV